MQITIKALNPKSRLEIYIDGEKIDNADSLKRGRYICDVEAGQHEIRFIKKPEILSKKKKWLAIVSFWLCVFGALPDSYKEMTKMAEEHIFSITMNIDCDIVLNVNLTRQGKISVDGIPQHAQTYQETKCSDCAMRKIKLYFFVPICLLITIIGVGILLLAFFALLNARLVQGVCIFCVFLVYITIFFYLIKKHR